MSDWKDYYEASKNQNLPETDQKKGLPQPPLQMAYDPKAQLIDLPDSKSCDPEQTDFLSIVESRESRRLYSEQALTLAELSYLLWMTQGVKTVSKTEVKIYTAAPCLPPDRGIPLRPTFSLTGWKGCRRVCIVIWRWNVNCCWWMEARMSTRGSPMLARSKDTFRIVRSPFAGWRILHEPTGVIVNVPSAIFCWMPDMSAQNLYLAAESIHCGTCAIAAYDDDLLNAALGVDGVHQFAAYLATLGKVA